MSGLRKTGLPNTAAGAAVYCGAAALDAARQVTKKLTPAMMITMSTPPATAMPIIMRRLLSSGITMQTNTTLSRQH